MSALSVRSGFPVVLIRIIWHSRAILVYLARIFHELLSRDHEDGRATWQPQGVGSEAHLNGASQGPTLKDARKDVHIRGRSK
jgi:glutathione S-transferase